MKKIFLAFAALLFLVSCSSMNQKDCLSANWENLGYNDATNRYFYNYASYVSSCSEFNISPVQSEYELGFKKGLKELCTFQNGYLIGNEGHTLPKICPLETQESFVKGFIEGQRNYDQKKQLEKQNQLIEKALDSNAKSKYEGLSCVYNSDCPSNGKCERNKCKY